MARKATTIFIILLTTILFMGQNVIPTRHNCSSCITKCHSRQICKGGCKKKCRNCVFYQVTALPEDLLRHVLKVPDNPDNHNSFNVHYDLMLYAQSNAYSMRTIANGSPPTLISSSYSNYVRNISGLRGPPVI